MAQDYTRGTSNYFAHGGRELVIGGKLTFLPSATVEGCEGLFGDKEPSAPAGHVPEDSKATTVAALREDFNALLAALREAGFVSTKE